MFEDSSDVDLALPGGQPLRTASVKQFFRCIGLLYRGVGDVREGQTPTGRSRELLDRATGAIEMQRVHENANARPAGRVYDACRGIEVGHNGPRKEFQHGLKSVSDSEFVDPGQPVGKSRQIRIVGRSDDLSRFQFGAGRQKRLETGDVNVGGNAHKLDIEHTNARFRHRGFRRAHHFRGAHERVARTSFRDSDQAKPYSPVSSARRDSHNLRRRKTDHRQGGERERNRHREFRRQSPHLAPPACPRPLHPRVSTMAPN